MKRLADYLYRVTLYLGSCQKLSLEIAQTALGVPTYQGVAFVEDRQ